MIGSRHAVAIVCFLVDFSNKQAIQRIHALQGCVDPDWERSEARRPLFTADRVGSAR
jgi:hypothetical protein